MSRLEEKAIKRKYGTAGRAMATRHYKTIKGAKSNVEGPSERMPRGSFKAGGFKTVGATAGGKYHKRGKPRNVKMVPIKIDRAYWVKEGK